ncbi:MAG: WbqC family protein [Fibrobacter sp.]|nr:WbqC family protein [Fibrobacter sp.]
MIIAANQPYFLPYIAYWQLINLADVFLIGDNYAYMKHGWVNRNRILERGKDAFFGIEIVQKSVNRYINETQVKKTLFPKKLKTLVHNYAKAPYFEQGYALMERIFANSETNLSRFLEFSIREICSYLGITTKIGHTSDFVGNNKFKREERVYDFCHRLGGDIYVNPIGGQKLYHFDEFRRQNITLKFIKSECRPYKQFDNEFVPGLSILDIIMFNPVETIQEMLQEYSFIEAPVK